MIAKYVFCLLATCAATPAFSQDQIRYVKRGGLNWIVPVDQGISLGVVPTDKISENRCRDVLKFTASHERIKACKNNDTVLCTDKIKNFLAATALRLGFKQDFDGDPEKIPASASVNWRLNSQMGTVLKPSLLEEYASRLQIDPNESVVAVISRNSVRVSNDKSLFAIFRPYEQGSLGGSSYFFSHDIPLFQGNHEASIYFGPSKKGDQYLRLSSRILNCELQAYPEEYVAIPFNYTMDGRRPVSPSQSEEIQTASRKLAAEQMPADSTDVQKALIYGFLLARSISDQTIDKIGMENIINKVFDTQASSLSVKYYPTTEELAEALSVVASYRQEGGYVKLVPELGSESNVKY